MQAVENSTVSSVNVKKIAGKRGRPLSEETKHARIAVGNILNLRKPGQEFTSHKVAEWLKTNNLNMANNVINYWIAQGRIVKVDKTIKQDGKRGRPQSVFTKAENK